MTTSLHAEQRWWLPLLIVVLGVLSCAAATRPAVARAGTLPVAVGSMPLPSLAPMLKGVMPAVVNIASKTVVRERDPFFNDPVFRQFFGLSSAPRERVEQSLGSGVIVDASKGYVLTNNHVIAGADRITVTLQDGRSMRATVIGSDPATDIAVLRIPAQHLSALPVADSSRLQVGDFVVAVGNPFGLGQTVTSGIVSALGRSGLGSGYQDFIQTDASINPGNSGGALVNLAGQLVGINSMIYSPSGGNVGIGFAIPSDLALQIMRQLIRYGSVRRGSLGIETQSLTPVLAHALGLRPGAEGLVVTRIQPDSAAAHAGMRRGDVLHALNGQTLRTPSDLANIEGLLPIGRAAHMVVLRGMRQLDLQAPIEPVPLATAAGSTIDPRLAGSLLSDLASGRRPGGLSGVALTRVAPGSRAAASGLRPGDVIIGINQRRVNDIADLRALLAIPPRRMLLTVVRDGRGLNIMAE